MRRLLKDDEYSPEMPEIGAEHVIAYLFEIGPTLFGNMGEAPLSHTEIAAWQENTGVVLSSWEARSLLLLSKEYLLQAQRAEKPDCPAPWSPEGLVARQATALSMRESIRSLMKL